MAKSFLEVFPDLHMTAEMNELFRLVCVERVSSTRDRSSLRVYINSPRLIDKRNIHALEKGIREQLFPGKKLTVKIMEKYSLSGQYNPEKLFQVYTTACQCTVCLASANRLSLTPALCHVGD